jgi:hypothetical protein
MTTKWISIGLGALVLLGCGRQVSPMTPAMRATFESAFTPPLAARLAATRLMGTGATLEAEAPTGARRVQGLGALPPHVDLRPECPPVYHQGPFFTCTAFAVAKGLGEYLLRRGGDPTALSAAHFYAATEDAVAIVHSRDVRDLAANTWFLLDNPHVRPGRDVRDLGAPIAAAMATLELGGAVVEARAPYPPAAMWASYGQHRLRHPRTATHPALRYFDAAAGIGVGPTGEVTYNDAPTKLRIGRATRVADLAGVRAHLANGLPVVAGFKVHESFYGAGIAGSGRVPLPEPHEPYVGGHAMVIVGYDDASETLLVRNSWGATWGEAGHCRWPYAAFARGLITDAWTVAEP